MQALIVKSFVKVKRMLLDLTFSLFLHFSRFKINSQQYPAKAEEIASYFKGFFILSDKTSNLRS